MSNLWLSILYCYEREFFLSPFITLVRTAMMEDAKSYESKTDLVKASGQFTGKLRKKGAYFKYTANERRILERHRRECSKKREV